MPLWATLNFLGNKMGRKIYQKQCGRENTNYTALEFETISKRQRSTEDEDFGPILLANADNAVTQSCDR